MSSLRFFDFLPQTTRSIANQVPPLAREAYYLYRETLKNQEHLKKLTSDSFKNMLILCFKSGDEYFKKIFGTKKLSPSFESRISMIFDEQTSSASAFTNKKAAITAPSLLITR